MYLLLFPGPSSPDSPVLCRGTVIVEFFISCTSKAQAAHFSGCSMTAQSQLSHASPALPRPKWSGVLPEHSPRWGSLSNALPRSKLLMFQDVPEYTVPESHSDSQNSCDVIISGGLCFLCTAQIHSGQFLRYSTKIQSMNGELCIASEELLSGYDTLGTYKLSQIPGSHG